MKLVHTHPHTQVIGNSSFTLQMQSFTGYIRFVQQKKSDDEEEKGEKREKKTLSFCVKCMKLNFISQKKNEKNNLKIVNFFFSFIIFTCWWVLDLRSLSRRINISPNSNFATNLKMNQVKYVRENINLQFRSTRNRF